MICKQFSWLYLKIIIQKEKKVALKNYPGKYTPDTEALLAQSSAQVRGLEGNRPAPAGVPLHFWALLSRFKVAKAPLTKPKTVDMSCSQHGVSDP